MDGREKGPPPSNDGSRVAHARAVPTCMKRPIASNGAIRKRIAVTVGTIMTVSIRARPNKSTAANRGQSQSGRSRPFRPFAASRPSGMMKSTIANGAVIAKVSASACNAEVATCGTSAGAATKAAIPVVNAKIERTAPIAKISDVIDLRLCPRTHTAPACDGRYSRALAIGWYKTSMIAASIIR